MKRLLFVLMFLVSIGHLHAQSFPYTDPFTTPGSLSGFWAQTAATGTTFVPLVITTPGEVGPNTASSVAAATFTSGTFGTTPSIQTALTYTVGNFSAICLASTSLTGYCYYPSLGDFRVITNGVDAGSRICLGSRTASGDVIQVGVLASGAATVIDVTTHKTVCTAGSIGSGLLPVIMVDTRAFAGDFAGPATIGNTAVTPPLLQPTFTNPGQLWNVGFPLSILSPSAGAVVCYAFGATTPTAAVPGTCDQNTFSTALPINGLVTVNAIDTMVGFTNSAVSTATFSFGPFYPAAGTYHFSPVVHLFTNNGDVHIYTTDGSTPTANGSCTPTHGTLGDSVTVATSETVTFIGCQGGTSSGTQAAAYVIGSPTTWYQRNNGGPRYDATDNPTGTCDGTTPAAPVGGAANQHCAFSDVRYFWNDGGTTTNANAGFPLWGWIGAGGDTYDFEGGRVGQSGPTSGEYFGLSGHPTQAGMPSPPSGGPSTPTTIRGMNFAACTSDANKANLIGGYAIDNVIGLYYASYVNVECALINNHNGNWGTSGTITSYVLSGNQVTFTGTGMSMFNSGGGQILSVAGMSHTYLNQIYAVQSATSTTVTAALTHANDSGSDAGTFQNAACTRTGPTPDCQRSFPVSDFANNGFQTSNLTTNVLLQDVVVQGMALDATIGPIGAGIVLQRTRFSGNAFAGMLFDDGASTPNEQYASLDILNSIIEWSGCMWEWPIVDATPVINCADDAGAGFGDQLSAQGTGAGGTTSVLSYYIDHSIIRYGTKDGVGMNHLVSVNIPGRDAIHMTNSQFYGNQGQQIKTAMYNGAIELITNNLVTNNCHVLQQPFPGAPSGYNANLHDPCRASGIGLSLAVADLSNLTLAYNSVVGYSNPTVFLGISGTTADNAATGNFISKNNNFLGYATNYPGWVLVEPAVYNYEGDWGASTIRDHNNYFRQQTTCPTGFTGETCVDPLLVSEPVSPITSEAPLIGFNFAPTGSSPLIGAGLACCSITTDFAGNTRPNPPSEGALELGTTVSAPTCSPGTGTFSLSVTTNCSTSTGGASLVYATGTGNLPTVSGTTCTITNGVAYTGALTFSSTTVLNILGCLSGDNPSSATTYTFTITGAVTSSTTSSGSGRNSGSSTHN